MAVTITLGSAGPRRNLLIRQGATFAIPFVVTTDGKPTSPRMDITSADIRAQIRRLPTSEGAPTATFSAVKTNPEQGEYVLLLSAVQTSQIPAGDFPTDKASRYHWDGEIEFPSGEVRPAGYGSVAIHAEVTR